MLLGNFNIAHCWYTWCQLSPKQWGEIDHEKGIAWTRAAMDAVREAVNEGHNSNTSENRNGCVSIYLFDDIDIIYFILPVLHASIGMGNFS